MSISAAKPVQNGPPRSIAQMPAIGLWRPPVRGRPRLDGDVFERVALHRTPGIQLSSTAVTALDARPAPGRLVRIDGVTDGTSAPRTLWVWVPAEPPTHHLYVHDGQNLFDPRAPHGGWDLQHQVGPRTLVIGIETTRGRFDDLTPWPDEIGTDEPTKTTESVETDEPVGGRGEAFANLVLKTIRPLIEERFGTPQRRGVMGSSLGGLMALYQAARDPEAWDFAASLSGTVGWGRLGQPEGPQLIDAFDAPTPHSPCLYMDSGGYPGGPDNYDDNQRLAKELAERGYRRNRNLFHWHEPNAKHTEKAWRERVWRPLSLFEGRGLTGAKR